MTFVKPVAPRIVSSDSDTEMIHQDASPPDEGYESAQPTSDVEDEYDPVEHPKVVQPPKTRGYKAWEASDDEVDEAGNLRGFIDDDEEWQDEMEEEPSEMHVSSDGEGQEADVESRCGLKPIVREAAILTNDQPFPSQCVGLESSSYCAPEEVSVHVRCSGPCSLDTTWCRV